MLSPPRLPALWVGFNAVEFIAERRTIAGAPIHQGIYILDANIGTLMHLLSCLRYLSIFSGFYKIYIID